MRMIQRMYGDENGLTIEYEEIPNCVRPLYCRNGGPKTTVWTPGIDRVIFNDPATIVFWEDGKKTVVKAHDEKYDPEKGLAMCIAKRYFGNEGNYYNHLKPWVEEEKKRRADEFEKWLRKEFGGAE